MRAFRHPRRIVLSAIVLYALTLVAGWMLATARAERRARDELVAAEEQCVANIVTAVDEILRKVATSVLLQLNGVCAPQSFERMEALAKTYDVDEVNVVDERGVVIGSNVRHVLGDKFGKRQETAEFLALLSPTARVTCITQKFRCGTANPEMRCAYGAVPFPKRVGLVQVGVSDKRFAARMNAYTHEESAAYLHNCSFGVAGWFETAYEKEFENGAFFRRWDDDDHCMTLGRYFQYESFQFKAVMPESACYAQRNYNFVIAAIILALFASLFTFFLVAQVKASVKIEALHAEAEARNAADLALARTIQMSALPSSEGAFADRLEFSFRAASRPAREVGGDFYDFYHLSGRRICFLVADVSGKGISGALFMMEAKNILKNCLMAHADIADAVTAANGLLCSGNGAEFFVTAWIGALDTETGEMQFVNAGHNRPFLRRADGRVEKIAARGGRFLGMFEDATYAVHTLTLAAGDTLYLYTDGVTEAMNAKREVFGERRLAEALAEGAAHVRPSLGAFVAGAEQSDDMTALWLRWNGRPAKTERTFPCAADDTPEAALAFVREALSGCDAKVCAALLNATDELVTNVVTYSGSPDVTIGVEKGHDRVRLTLSDSGVAYNPLAHPDPDTHAAIEQRDVGGLGILVVKRLVDRVNYARMDDRNVLCLLKFAPPETRG